MRQADLDTTPHHIWIDNGYIETKVSINKRSYNAVLGEVQHVESRLEHK
jgi:hypothetical protein